MEAQHVVVIGAGAAGRAAADELMRSGWRGPVSIVEPAESANRTLVSKGVLPGLLTPEQTHRPAPEGVDVLHDHAVSVLAGPAVVLASGAELRPAAVLIASGSRPRELSDGLRLTRPSRLTTLHSASDALRVRDWLPLRDARALVLGAGLVGSEAASVLAEYGVAVTLVSASPLPLRAQLGPEVASALVARHRTAVETRFGRHVLGVDGGRDTIRVELDRGEFVEADVAVVAYGTVPVRPWFLGTEEGAIPVDDRLRTPVRGVYAAGGVASVHDGPSQTRVDHWEDAEAQGRHAARAMLHDLAGAPDPGAYRFLAAFSSRIHGATLSGWGVAGPTTRWHQPMPRVAMSLGTSGGRTTAAVGLDAAAAVRAAREAEADAAEPGEGEPRSAPAGRTAA